MSTVDFTQHVSASAYVPRPLIVLVPDLKKYTPCLEDVTKQQMASDFDELLEGTIASIFEIQVMRTSVRAVENQRRLLQDNVQNDYSQDFHFSERYAKVIYHSLRLWRDRRVNNTLRLLLLEPDPTLSKILDAWEIVGKIDQIRNSAVPTRDLVNLPSLEQNREGIEFDPDGKNYVTTVSVKGKLTHTLNVLEEGRLLWDKMNKAALSPNLQKAFVEGISQTSALSA